MQILADLGGFELCCVFDFSGINVSGIAAHADNCAKVAEFDFKSVPIVGTAVGVARREAVTLNLRDGLDDLGGFLGNEGKAFGLCRC